MKDQQSWHARSNEVIGIRFGGDSRLHFAWVAIESPDMAADIIVVENDHGERRVARVVVRCDETEAQPIFGCVVAGYTIDPASSTRLEDIVDNPVPRYDREADHLWGGLGLPSGIRTHVSPVGVSLDSDVAYSLSSRGYREVQSDRFHQLLPGDRVEFQSGAVVITMIDRRKDSVELRQEHDQSIVEMPLARFLEETH